MKRITVLVVFLISSFLSLSQNFEWATSVSQGRNYAQDIVANNNYAYQVGSYTGTVDIDPSSSVFMLNNFNASNNGYITCINNDGTLNWGKSIEGQNSNSSIICRSITIDSDNNLYVTGTFKGSVDFSLGGATNIVNSVGVQDLFILKTDVNGNLIWIKFIQGSGGSLFSRNIFLKNDNLYINGTYTGSIDFDPSSNTQYMSGTYNSTSFILKLTKNGGFVWTKRNIKSSNIYGGIAISDVDVDNFGNLYTCGSIRGEIIFEDTTHITEATNNSMTNFDGDAFIEKRDTSGNFIWLKIFQGNSDDYILSVESDSLGNLYCTGNGNYGMDLDPSSNQVLLSDMDNKECFVLKLNSLGNFIWAKAFVPSSAFGSNGFSIRVDKSNNIYSIGGYYLETDINPDPNAEQILPIGGKSNFYIQKLDAGGNFIWGKGIQSDLINASLPSNYKIFVTENLNIYTSGSFHETIDLDPDNTVFIIENDSNYFHSFIQKFNQCTPSFGTDSQTVCFKYTWINDSTYTSSNNSAVYTLVGQSATGCDSIVTLNLTIDTVNTITDYSNEILIAITQNSEYQWLYCNTLLEVEGEQFQEFTPIINGQYSVQIIENNCIDTSICISITNLIDTYAEGIGVPQAFSPNNDGNNDVLFVKGNGIKTMIFEVYNRYGEKVFTSNNQNIGWDGKFKNKELNPSVFAWTLNCTFIDGSENNYKGNVTLLK